MKIILNNGKEIEVECCECEEERKYDKKGNLIWHKYRNGTIEEWKYDKEGNLIWFKDTDGTTIEKKYDKQGNIIWHKNTDGTYWIDGKPYREVKK